jgi:hypothetical protein
MAFHPAKSGVYIVVLAADVAVLHVFSQFGDFFFDFFAAGLKFFMVIVDSLLVYFDLFPM